MLIVGSKALNSYYPYIATQYKDIDLIGDSDVVEYLIKRLRPSDVSRSEYICSLRGITKDDFFDTDSVEILLSDNSESLNMYLKYDNDSKFEIKYASLEVLYSLKKSHINFPVKFNKHIPHYSFLNKHFNGVDCISSVTKINFIETENRLGKLRTPSLNKSVKKFFDQSNSFFKSYFIHDDIHRAVAHYDNPLYEKMQVDKSMAKCEKYLWDEFSDEEKCKCVLEEAYVISLERNIIPMIFGGGRYHDSDDSFKWALMRICTTLCSGWFRQFATDNYYMILEYYNSNYVIDFLEKVDNGNIKRCDKKEKEEY